MDIRILEEAASRRIKEKTHEEAEKFMARIRTNLFDLLCHSDKARAELPLGLDLNEYGGRDAVERAIGKAVVNLLSLASVFGVRTCDVIIRGLGFVPESDTSVDAAEKTPGGNGSSPHEPDTGEAGNDEEKVGFDGAHDEPAPALEGDAGKGERDDSSEYRQRLDKAGSVEDRTAIWKKIQTDRGLDSKTRAELYRHMAALNKQETTK